MYGTAPEITYLQEGDTATVLGRSPKEYGEWFYIRTEGGIKGYAYAPYFSWGGNWNALPEVEPPPVKIVSPTPSQQPTPLSIEHIWWTARCVSGGWEALFEVKVKGGNGTYEFYWDDMRVEAEPKAGEEGTFIITRPGVKGMIVGTIRVKSGDQEVKQQASAKQPDC